MGKNKIEIKKIERADARQVCFSKRRQGVFKKASELAMVSGAEIGILVLSPAGKMFTFGCPDIDYVLQKLETGEGNLENEKVNRTLEMQKEYQRLLAEVEGQNKISEHLQWQLNHRALFSPFDADFRNFDWTKDISNLILEQLQIFGQQLSAFRHRVLLAAHNAQQIQQQQQLQGCSYSSYSSASAAAYQDFLRSQTDMVGSSQMMMFQNAAVPVAANSSRIALGHNHQQPYPAMGALNQSNFADYDGSLAALACGDERISRASGPRELPGLPARSEELVYASELHKIFTSSSYC